MGYSCWWNFHADICKWCWWIPCRIFATVDDEEDDFHSWFAASVDEEFHGFPASLK